MKCVEMLALAAAFLVPALAAAQTSPERPGSAAPAPGKLSGEAALDALIGNTIQGRDQDGGSYSAYFNPNGQLKQADDNVVTSGRWRTSGEKACFEFADSDGEDCYAVALDNGVASFTDEDGESRQYQVAPGDAVQTAQ